jgi:hypothetical protein
VQPPLLPLLPPLLQVVAAVLQRLRVACIVVRGLLLLLLVCGRWAAWLLMPPAVLACTAHAVHLQ